MLLDREILPTTICDDEFNVLAALFLDGRRPLMVPPEVRQWPRTATSWWDEGHLVLEDKVEVNDRGTFHAKLAMNRLETLEVVWSGNMPDQHGGFSKGELLGEEGYDMTTSTSSILERARLIVNVGKSSQSVDGDNP